MKKRVEKLFPLLLFIAAFFVYLLTINPGLGFTDSGELAAACVSLGIPHPTGYPLFILLGYLWTFIPLSSSAILNLNYFAAFLTALSALFFYFASIEFFKILDFQKESKIENSSNKLLALISALIYAFSLTVWEQSSAIEVYPLHILFVNIILLCFFKSFNVKEKKERYLILSAFLLGLSFTNHLTTVLLLPAILLLFVYPPFQNFSLNKNKFQFLLLLLIPFFIAVSLYIFLPIRSSALPNENWGWVHRGLDKFLYQIQGKQYQVWMFSGENLNTNIEKYFSALPMQFGIIGLIPLLLGLYYSFKKCRQLFYFLIALALVGFFYSINYSIHDIESYFLTSYIALIFFAAAGLKFLSEKSKKIIPFCFIVPLLSLALNFEPNDNSSDYLVDDYTENLVNNLEKDAIIISSQWDYWCSAFWYKQRVEGFRKDVVLIEMELLRRTWYPKQLQRWYPQVISKSKAELEAFLTELEKFESGGNYNPNLLQAAFEQFVNSIIEKNYENRPIYITLDISEREPGIARNYYHIPIGFALQLQEDMEKTKEIDMSKIKIDRFANSMKGKSDNHLISGIKDLAAINLMNVASYCILSAQEEKAIVAIDFAKKISPNNEFVKRAEELW